MVWHVGYFVRIEINSLIYKKSSKKAEEKIRHAYKSVKLLTNNPNSKETKKYLDYIQSQIIGGIKENILFSFETLNNDLIDKNAPIHSVPHIRTSTTLSSSRNQQMTKSLKKRRLKRTSASFLNLSNLCPTSASSTKKTTSRKT